MNSTIERRTPLKRSTVPLKRSYIRKPTYEEVKLKNLSKRRKQAVARSGITPKKKLDQLFSRYIRQKYAINGMVQCVTCQIIKPWQDMQAGHFISRSYLATRFDEENVFPQCQNCNEYHQGRLDKFEEFLAFNFGPLHTDVLKIRAQAIIPEFPYEDLIEEYRQKLSLINNVEEVKL